MQEYYIEKKIYYHDTDCGGVVYYANYLKYLEEGRCEYCLSRGVILKDLVSQGIYFAVARTEIDYKLPVHYQDILKVFTRIEKIGRCSVDFLQEIKKENMVVVVAKTFWVCVGRDFKPRPVSEEVKQSFNR